LILGGRCRIGLSNLNDISDDDDLPGLEAGQEQPRDKAGKFVSQGASPEHIKPEEPKPAHTHTPYFVSIAKQLGLTDDEINSTPPAVLEKWAAKELVRPEKVVEKPVEKVEPEEDDFDWGADGEGNQLTEERAKKYYTGPVFRAIKASKDFEQVKKDNAELRQKIEADQQDRSRRMALREVHKVFATRADLFGKLDELKEGTKEFDRYQLALQHIDRLLATKKGHGSFKADAEAAIALFGPAPATPKPTVPRGTPEPNGQTNGHSLADYARAELATPTARRSDERVTKRDARITAKRAELREQGYQFSDNPLANDDDDLPE
jgi:hypothetical protein